MHHLGRISGEMLMAPHHGDSPPLIHGFLRQARKQHGGSADRTSSLSAGKRRSGLSQQDVAQYMGVSTRLYQDWEGGVRPIPQHRLDSLAEALGLDSARRDELWFVASGGFPPRGPSRPDPEAVTGWTSYLRALPVPSLAVDAGWRIEESNTAWQRLFLSAGEPEPANLLRFVLFNPYARRLCGEWQDGWAISYLRQLRLEAETTRSAELRRIIDELQDHPELAELWRAVDRSSRITLHNDGQVRIIVPPVGGHPQHVRTLVSTPAHDPRRRMVTFLPTQTAA
ncbi:MmyB family transcriptional regulator [Actinacidiphila bryophytorum]|uniref:MmyB family transcriptional regulator n=1 Tax=Actinacidiphila bryophytorum TaxID=1436133 RepID=UPI002176ED22|nr:helix-turn-helix domain-containing protein [Actinacidiphila bryophytorum]UWE12991.1 helix-turn-helix domain-containing protein [Actinacidiphila bryophytorum]